MAVILVFIEHGNICISLVIFGPNSILWCPNYGKGFFLSSLERNKTILWEGAILVVLPSQELKHSASWLKGWTGLQNADTDLCCKTLRNQHNFLFCEAVFSPVQAWAEKSQHHLAGEGHILKHGNRTVVNPALQSPLNAPGGCSVCIRKEVEPCLYSEEVIFDEIASVLPHVIYIQRYCILIQSLCYLWYIQSPSGFLWKWGIYDFPGKLDFT